MLKILGIDPATNLGWAYLEDKKLIDYGTVNCNLNLDIKQKIVFYKNSITKIIKNLQPDYIFVEDVILCISGVKTLIYLTRINSAVLMSLLEEYDSSKIYLIEPGKWKSENYLNLNGNSKKFEVQKEVCKFFNLIEEKELEEKLEILNHFEKENLDLKKRIYILKTKNEYLKKDINRKKINVLSESEKKESEEKIVENNKEIKRLNLELKEKTKLYNKEGNNITKFILYKTNLTEDICDAISIALHGFKILETKGV